MKVLLIQPPLNKNIIGAGVAYLTEPLGLEVLASYLDEHETRISDLRLKNTLDSDLNNFNPDVVGITCCTTDVYSVKAILKKIKAFNNDILTVAGGHHPTMVPEDFFDNYTDVIVLGEGEITFKELLNTHLKKKCFKNVTGLAYKSDDGKFYFTGKRKMLIMSDKRPFPKRSLTKEYRGSYFRGQWKPLASLMTSKGCPFRCRFCAMWKISDGKYYVRNAKSVVDELEIIEEKFVDFAEDNAFHDVKRAFEMAELIKMRGIKKNYKIYARSDTIMRHHNLIEKWAGVGMKLVLVGLESFRDRELKLLNKGNTVKNNERAVEILHSNGMEVVGYFIVHQDYTADDFKQLGDYAEKLKLKQPIFTVLTPLPGTELYNEKYSELTTKNYELYDFLHSVLPTKLPLDVFYKELLELYKRFYSPGGKWNIVSSREILDKVYSSLVNSHNSKSSESNACTGILS